MFKAMTETGNSQVSFCKDSSRDSVLCASVTFCSQLSFLSQRQRVSKQGREWEADRKGDGGELDGER